MQAVLQMLAADPEITAVSFPYLEFWGGFDYRTTGQWHIYDHPAFHRLFRWGPGYQYVEHRPPTVVDESGRDLRELKWVDHKTMRRKGIYLYHYSYVLPKQAQQKVGYYANVSWTDAFRENERWYQESYLALKHPFFVGEKGRKVPQWLQRFQGQHPADIVRLRNDLQKGRIHAAMRPVENIESLLGSRSYKIGCWLLRVYLFVFWHLRKLVKPVTRWLRALLSNKTSGGNRDV